jgi:hypothetical protein
MMNIDSSVLHLSLELKEECRWRGGRGVRENNK